MISNWQDSPYDVRPRRLALADACREFVIPDQVAEVLRELRLLDPDAERLVFRIRAHHDGAAVTATADDLEELMGFVAVEANHEPNRRRRRRIDATFDVLNDALAAMDG